MNEGNIILLCSSIEETIFIGYECHMPIAVIDSNLIELQIHKEKFNDSLSEFPYIPL